MMEAKKKYEKPAFRLVTDLGSILECLYEVYGTDGTMLIAGNKLSDTVIYPFIRMIKKKCKAVDAEKLNLTQDHGYGHKKSRDGHGFNISLFILLIFPWYEYQ